MFCFQGESIFGWLELVEFRLYLGALHYTLPFLALAIFLLGYSCLGEILLLLYMFLDSTAY